MNDQKKTHVVTLEFDSEDSAKSFFAYWLDGGGDGGGNLDWNTDKWRSSSYMRISGTGEPIDWDENE